MDMLNFIAELAEQENAPLAGKTDTYPVKPNVAPEDGGGMDVGFGHKLSAREHKLNKVYGVDMDACTAGDCAGILAIDFAKHYFLAQNLCGPDFDRMPKLAQWILAEFSFNGVLRSFPRFRTALLTRNKTEAFNQYKRYWTYKGERRELTKRNEWTLVFLERLVDDGWLR